MKITIDGVEVILQGKPPEDFGTLVKLIEKGHIPPGRVVTVLKLNDESLTDEQETAFANRPVSDIETLDLVTSPALDLAVEALMDFQEYLPKLSEQLEKCAKEFRGGDNKEAFRLFTSSVEFVSSFIGILDDIRAAFFIDYSKLKCGDKTLLDLNVRMNELAKEILEASESTDWTHLADLLEYELSPLLYEWMAEIPELIKVLEGKRDFLE